jgi:diguanylate cyclase (GGDEF)-like protein
MTTEQLAAGVPSRAARLAQRWLRAALVAYAGLLVLWRTTGLGSSVIIDNVGQNTVLLGAAALIAARAVTSRAARSAWALTATGLTLYTSGNLIYFLWVADETPVPTPSIADVAWLGSYPLLFAGLFALLRQRIDVSDATLWLDAAVAAAGLSALASLWLTYLLDNRPGQLWASVIGLAYPIGDLIQLTVLLAACAMLGGRLDRTMRYLGAGLALFAIGDTVYSIEVTTGSWHQGSWMYLMWTTAAVLMAAAAWRPPATVRARRGYGPSALVTPGVFAATSLVILAVSARHRLPAAAVVAATLTLALVLVRAAWSFREVASLLVSRSEARTDELTGVSNRRHLAEQLDATLESLTDGDTVALLLIDLDRFKEVNDSHGHGAGDRLLTEAARRLREILGDGAVLARLGGDEFAVLLSGIGADGAVATGERLRTALQLPFPAGSATVTVDASVGVAVASGRGLSSTGLLHAADLAMYRAKAYDLGVSLHEDDSDPLAGRHVTAAELRTAIAERQLVLHFQPQQHLASGRMVGAEALVRWQHPQRGLIGPDQFIGDAERLGLMRELTAAVLDMALDAAATWQAAGQPCPVAVNVSVANLADRSLPEQVRRLLEARGLAPSALVLEVTETALMRDTSRAVTVLHELRELGVRLSIDDYGTGYSSLGRLRDLPINELKLDRSFIAELATDPRAAAIVESTIALAHSLGLSLVAEGIETEQALRRLTEMGCDVGQGYHIARPSALAPYEALPVRDALPVVGSVPAPR